ncbi:LysR family transcriptional regulator [Klebsiella aerogenes]|uniref:LysR family transcriptional regulator n=1 Tax=Klebsiella aerogenes TaxID=548 RepID=UPI00244A15EC|nr:LysR family transcriptional regulator [Klebsiella aerogenes]MDH1612400.1 LysR family transcriptional regulator [Klebsiella aerogenes]
MINLDLKVLKAVHILCDAGSVSKTAEILNVTPGAVTYLINKARAATGSALFIRGRNGMSPNPLAKELSARYLTVAEELSTPEHLASNRKMVISSYSLAELLLSLETLESTETFPELVFQRQLYDDNERLLKLRNREVDLDIGTRLPADNSVIQLRFFAGNAGVLARKNHRTIRNSVTLQDWQENRHAIWLRGMHFINDNFEKMHDFEVLSHQKNIAFTASSSLNLINLCILSDVIVMVPEIVGRKLSSVFSVNWFPPPEELDMRYECYIHYHRTMSGNDRMKQLVALFHRAFDL